MTRPPPGLRIRPGRPGDGPGAAKVFHAAVHEGARRHYTKDERAAWSPAPPEGAAWEARLLSGTCLVATDWRGRVQGFMTLGRDGYLDYAYVAPRWMGRGVADTLYARIEVQARVDGLPQLSTEASHLARAFFTRHGWYTDARQAVIRHGVAIANFRMSKFL